MKIIDAHSHIYPTKIAEKATVAIGDFYDIPMHIKAGTADYLLEEGKAAGISNFVVHSCATKSSQVRSINVFIKEEIDLHNEFIGFMTLHQDMSEEEMYNEVSWAVKNGFKGVKLHPDFQKFYIDDANVEKIYRAVGDRLPILFHTGDNRFEYSKPFRLAAMAKKYKNVNFIGAHFGGYRCWDELDVYNGLDNVYFDTSSSLAFISVEKATSLIKHFGAERFFFGTDYPMWTAKEEIERFLHLPLKDSEREIIFSENLEKLLKI